MFLFRFCKNINDMRKPYLMLLFLISIGLLDCASSGNLVEPETNVEIFATYSNPNGTPALNIDRAKLPPIVNVANVQSLTNSTNCRPTRVCLSIRNVRFQDSYSNAYELVTQNTFEINGGKFIQDVENQLTVTTSRTLDFVLVLDVSNSLGADLAKVKQYANDFIDQVKAKSPSSNVGIVTFSRAIETLPLTNDFASAKSFIQNKTGVDETRLFEAIDTGLKLLTNSSADGKAILIFTDGINNASSDPAKYQTINYISDQLKKTTGTPVSSFAIGLDGSTASGALQSQLAGLTSNGGFYEVAPNSSVLQSTFAKFANSISAVYTFTYDRNDSRTSTPIDLKFVLTLKTLN